ncbi:MAG: flagellar filament capping protein FliD [Clostridiaceae bacterium]|nr:flagellar filament capping protein FliD [Clostridiaceae bacterium]
MNGISGFTSQMRMTGLSGFDTETIVTELMKAERIPLDTLKQKRTLLEWKQEAYREISSALIGFKSKFFDIINRATYILSQNAVKAMSAVSSNSSYVTATATSEADIGEHSIRVVQLAAAGSLRNSSGISKGITGSIVAAEGESLSDKLASLEGKKIFIELDGVSKQITLGGTTAEDFKKELIEALDEAFGKVKIGDEEISKFDVSINETENGFDFTINTNAGSGATRIRVYGPPGPTEELAGLNDLGLIEGESNRLSLNTPLLNLKEAFNVPLEFDAEGNAEFTINGETIRIKSTDTLKQVFDKINNNEKTKAKISYDEITDRITLTSTVTGAGNTITVEDVTGNFLTALNLDESINGHDAIVTIDGETIVRSTNNFNINGVTYNLHKAHEAESKGDTITVSRDTESVINNIKSFIEEYNKLIDSINGKISEKYDRNYLPLTDAQKDAMKEKDIEKWEDKAKTGLLRNDSILQDLVLSMRTALYEKVEGVGITLKDIGIESKSYSDKGKLYLDEDKLKNALLTMPDEVAKLLNGVSAENPSYSRTATAEQRADRYKKSGVLQRLSDIIEDHVSTFRDKDGRKGILLEKAGIEGDLSNTKNLLSEQLGDYDKRISDMIYKLTRKEESYYKKFSELETILARMNQQSMWLTSMFNNGS